MVRPLKQTVKYFPHDTDASEGKTLTIIQNKFGNDGFSFWFRLLELLGKTSGHFYDCNSPGDWEFLLAKTHINDTEKAMEILETLAKLDAIDRELFQSGIIWSQNFVTRISDAYHRTKEGVPTRPDIKVNADSNRVNADNNSKKDTLIPQTKLKETKVKNIINNIPIPTWIDLKVWDAFIEMRTRIKAKPTERAIAMLISELEKFKAQGMDPNEILKQSIMNNWRGVFPLKNQRRDLSTETFDSGRYRSAE